MIKRPLIFLAAAYILGSCCCRYNIKLSQFFPAAFLFIVFIFIIYFYKLSKYKSYNILKIIPYDFAFFLMPFVFILGYRNLNNALKECCFEANAAEKQLSVTGSVEYIKGIEGKYKIFINTKNFYNKILIDNENINYYAKTKKNNDINDVNNISTKDINDIGINAEDVEKYPCGLIMFSVETLNLGQNKISIGDVLTIEGKAECFSRASNLGQFDAYEYYKSEKVCLSVKIESIKINRGYKKSLEHIIKNRLFILKCQLMETISNIFESENYGSVAALILGEKSAMNSDIKKLYQDNGIMHIMSISGMHISLILSGVILLLNKMGIGKKRAVYAAAAVIFLYALMINAGVSAKRAVIMSIISCTAIIAGYTYDLLSALSLAALVILSEYPLKLYDSAFLLSFLAVLGIAVIYRTAESVLNIKDNEELEQNKFKQEKLEQNDKAKGSIRKILKKLANAALFSISIQIMSLPAVLNFFYFIPVYSVILNLIVIPLITIALIAAVFSAVISILNSNILSSIAFTYEIFPKIAAVPAEIILNLYTSICNIFKKFPFSRLVIGKLKTEVMIVYYIVLAIAVIFIIKQQKKRYLFVLLFPLFVLGLNDINKQLQVTFLDIGQGECIYIEGTKGETFMIDAGSTSIKNAGKYITIPFLSASGKEKVDYLFITHGDKDHINAAVELIKEKMVENLVLADNLSMSNGYKEVYELALENDTNVIFIEAGMEIKVGNNRFLCLSPKDAAIDENESSLVLLFIYRNFKMLMGGDCDSTAELEFLNKFPKLITGINVYKAAHHGSMYSNSAELLNAVKPDVCVISCGKNNSYGHPHLETIDRIVKTGAEIYITNEYGAVNIYSDGISFTIETFLCK